MTFAEFLVRAVRDHPREQRVGQWYFNLLAEARPDLAERVRGTDLDPFHRDDRLPAFLRYAVRHWDEPPRYPPGSTGGAP